MFALVLDGSAGVQVLFSSSLCKEQVEDDK